MAHDESPHPFKGRHLFGELYEVAAQLLDDEILLTKLFIEAIPRGKATICGLQSKHFEPFGVTVLALLAESHASLHTYPEQHCLFIDIFTCGAGEPRQIFDHIVACLRPGRTIVTEIERGGLTPLPLSTSTLL